MALFVRQDEQKSELQTRVAADMEKRLRDKADISDSTSDNDSEHYDTTRLAGVIIFLLILLAVIAMVVAVAVTRGS